MKARNLLGDLNDTRALSASLSQIILFTEAFNGFAARKILDSPEANHSISSLLLAFRLQLSKRGAWPDQIAATSMLSKAQRLPQFHSPFHDALIEFLVEPAVVIKSEGYWTLSASSKLPHSPIPSKLTYPVWLGPERSPLEFLTRHRGISDDSGERSKATVIRGWFLDQVLDPIAICHKVLTEANNERNSVERAEFLLQRSLRKIFSISYSNESKYSLAKIAAYLNDVFFSSSSFRVEDFKGLRSSVLSTTLLVRGIADCLLAKGASSSNYEPELFRQALGCFWFARFSRIVRVRYFKLTEVLESPSGSPSTDEWKSGQIIQCLSALRRSEYGYFSNRVFGSISDLQGLNFVFRGGILPRTQTGRVLLLSGRAGSGKTVLALQKLSGVASRGGLAIYFSFEERLDLLVDRLVAFDLLDQDSFDVVSAGDDLESQMRERSKNGRGLLALFTLGKVESFRLLEIIRRIGALPNWKWKALVIDSINAIQFHSEAADEPRSFPNTERIVARNIIEEVESAGFLGLIIREETRGQFDDLEYVADTVLRLGFDQGDRSRWLEIVKCRSQNFHGGKHKIRFVEGEGITVIPSLGAIRSTLRRRTRSTLTLERLIPIPDVTSEDLTFLETPLAEKSSALVYGGHGSGKTATLLMLATEPTRLNGPVPGAEEPRSVLFVNFRTTEERFTKNLRANKRLEARWTRLRSRRVRWFSPGETLTGDEVVWEIWQHIQRSRRQGLPIQRIVFDEVEYTEVALPGIAGEKLFWTTLLYLCSTEGITVFLGLGLEHPKSGSHSWNVLSPEVDYIISVKGMSPPLRSIGMSQMGEASRRTVVRNEVNSTPPATREVLGVEKRSISLERYPEEMRALEGLWSEISDQRASRHLSHRRSGIESEYDASLDGMD